MKGVPLSDVTVKNQQGNMRSMTRLVCGGRAEHSIVDRLV
jgi:hypothetical protein